MLVVQIAQSSTTTQRVAGRVGSQNHFWTAWMHNKDLFRHVRWRALQQ